MDCAISHLRVAKVVLHDEKKDICYLRSLALVRGIWYYLTLIDITYKEGRGQSLNILDKDM